MPRHMDRHLQRIMDNATSSNDRNRSGDYAFGDARSAECRLREAPRQSDEAMLLGMLPLILSRGALEN